MRFARTTIAVTATAAGVLALGACQGNTGASDAASSPPPVSVSPSGTTTPPSGSGAGATTGPSTGPTGAPGNAGSSRCHADDIGYSWATGGDAVPDPHSTDQQSAFVVLKNTSGHTCVLRGFPGADLDNSGKQWSLTRSSQSPHTISLDPGDSTQFTVTFMPWSAKGNVASNDFAPTILVVTLPNETKSYDIPWRWGHVLLQDAATHPGTYIGPVGD